MLWGDVGGSTGGCDGCCGCGWQFVSVWVLVRVSASYTTDLKFASSLDRESFRSFFHLSERSPRFRGARPVTIFWFAYIYLRVTSDATGRASPSSPSSFENRRNNTNRTVRVPPPETVPYLQVYVMPTVFHTGMTLHINHFAYIIYRTVV